MHMFYCWHLLLNEPSLVSFHTSLYRRGQYYLCLSLIVRKHFFSFGKKIITFFCVNSIERFSLAFVVSGLVALSLVIFNDRLT